MGKHARSVASQVLQRIEASPTGFVFTAADFLDLGSRGAVDQALSRKARAGVLRKVARGSYRRSKSAALHATEAPRTKAIPLRASVALLIRSIARRHGIEDPRVFGSVAAGTSRRDSDLDLLVRLGPGRGYSDLLSFCDELEERLGRRVDVLTEDALHPVLHRSILREAIAL